MGITINALAAPAWIGDADNHEHRIIVPARGSGPQSILDLDRVTSTHPSDRMDCIDYDRLVVTGKIRFLPLLVGW